MADCPTIESRSDDLEVRFPGGITIKASLPGVSAPALNLSQQMMAQASAIMSPLAPIFNIVGVITALKDFIQALVTNPFDIATAAVDLFEKIAKVASLIPALSVPAMVLDLVGVIATYLSGVASALESLVAQEARIEEARAIAEENDLDELRQAVECAEEQVAAILENLKGTAGPVDSLIELINLFASLVPGMPEIPSLSDLGDSASEAAETVRTIASILQGVRDAIPL